MNIQNYLLISRYFEYCWTGDAEKLKSLFEVDAVHNHVHIDEYSANLKCQKGRVGIDEIMKGYDEFFARTDLPSTKVYDLKLYSQNETTVIAEYRIYQRTKYYDHEFSVKQTFEVSQDDRITRVHMEVDKLDIHRVRV